MIGSAHVVRYETYWFEDPEHLPEEMQQLHRPREKAQLKKEVQEDSAWVSSLRFRAPPTGSALRRTRSSEVYPTPPNLSSSCGFMWEGSLRELTPPATPRGKVLAKADASRREDRSTSRRVVLLIEMELMGPQPGAPPREEERQTMTLRSWLQSSSRTLSEAADVFGILMLSVRHIHRKRIVHSDLKPDNIFCVAQRSKVKVVRIADFGLAGENQLFRQFDTFSSNMLRSGSGLAGGTPGYIAPEIFMSGRKGQDACSDKVDIYSCAVILLELLLQPFRTQMERVITLDKFNQHKIVPGFIAARLPKTRSLLQGMAESDPAARLSAEEVCKRFDKEARKELCRSASQLCCDSNPAWEKCDANPAGDAKREEPKRQGRRRRRN
ncbi:unnamed protein product [Effrenium voratum]|nr:unnamed protein product [Effrenium voratum]